MLYFIYILPNPYFNRYDYNFKYFFQINTLKTT